MVDIVLRKNAAPSRVAELMQEGARKFLDKKPMQSLDQRTPYDSSLIYVGTYSRIPIDSGVPAVPDARYAIFNDSGREFIRMKEKGGKADVALLARWQAVEPAHEIGLHAPPADYRTLAGYHVYVPMAVVFNGRLFELGHAEPDFEHVWDWVVHEVRKPVSSQAATGTKAAAQA